jgi:hypothetical protein
MNTIRDILEDLYRIDPDLKAFEQELIPLVQALKAQRPNVTPDATFVAELKRTLQKRATEPAPSHSMFSTFFMSPTFSYAVVGAVLGIVVAAPMTYVALQNSPAVTTDEYQESFLSYSVEEVGDRAFGDLKDASAGMSRNQSGGGGPVASPMAPMADGDVAATAETSNAKMVAPYGGSDMMIYPYYQYEYVYKGEPVELTDQNVSVMRRKKPVLPAAGSLLGMDLDLLNLGSFPGLLSDSFSMLQDRKNGYMVSVNLREGTVWINQNWEKWDNPATACQDEACFNRYRLKMSDVPADDVLINAANAFLQEHGIPLDHYGTPEVDVSWKQFEGSPMPADSIYVPDSITVMYPLTIDGQKVTEEAGITYGLSVGVSIRDKQVTSVWNLQSQNYESSEYPAVTSQDDVMNFLSKFEQPDMRLMQDVQIEKKTVELGTPTKGLVRMYRYDGTTQDELLVPALLFPVTTQPTEGYFYRKHVAVPLSKELFDEVLNRQNGGGMPMPLMEPRG